nr:NtaA/DmoA family FMN-dependent monooxygenase [uncultured Mycolicibacterium sp.]
MGQNPPQLILAAALMHGLGTQTSAWRVRGGEASDYIRPELYVDLARTGEEGKLHALFLAEQMTNRDGSLHQHSGENGTESPCGAMDTATVLSYMAAVTEHIGLVGTGSTTYNQPYDLARRFATLDNLSKGRTGWNSVTTANHATAEMFGGSGLDTHPEAAARYARADEFIEIVTELWASWEEGALVGDKAAGFFADPKRVREINYVGKQFSVRGPLPFPATAQGRPVIFHAGSSPEGRDQAARCADVAFTAQHTTEGAREYRDDMRSRAAAYGRNPDDIKVLPGISVVLGGTVAEAEAKKRALDDALPLSRKVSEMHRRTGLSRAVVEEYLDKPLPLHLLPPDSEFKGGIGWRQSIIDLAIAENLTVRELMYRAPGHHQHIIGTAETVADAMQERVSAGACDGFIMMIDMLPEGLHDIVEMLVPELQRRGMFHEDYEHATLRGNLGLSAPQPVPAMK